MSNLEIYLGCQRDFLLDFVMLFLWGTTSDHPQLISQREHIVIGSWGFLSQFDMHNLTKNKINGAE